MSELDDELKERLRAHQDACAEGMPTEERIEAATTTRRIPRSVKGV